MLYSNQYCALSYIVIHVWESERCQQWTLNGDKESVEEWHLGKCQTELPEEVLHVSLIMSLNIGDIFGVHLNEHRHKLTKITCTPPTCSRVYICNNVGVCGPWFLVTWIKIFGYFTPDEIKQSMEDDLLMTWLNSFNLLHSEVLQGLQNTSQFKDGICSR